jgi:hypothetical protein
MAGATHRGGTPSSGTCSRATSLRRSERAAGGYPRSFRARRDPRDLARAAGVLLGERLTELSGLRTRATVDPTVGQWLEVVRRAERATTTSLVPLRGIPSDGVSSSP